MRGRRDGQGFFRWGGGKACVRSLGFQAVGASLLLSGGAFPPEEAARNPALESWEGILLQLLLLVSFTFKKDTQHL